MVLRNLKPLRAPPRGLSNQTARHLEGAARRRAIEAAGRECKAAERREVSAGVAQTVALGEARGEAFTRINTPSAPVRRQTGLVVLANGGKLHGPALKCAAQYAQAFETIHAAASIRSALADAERASEGPSQRRIGAASAARFHAQAHLFHCARVLGHQRDMLAAINAVIGEGKTPREAGGNAVGSAVHTALVVAAFDILAADEAATNLRN